jgi:hypothetical protein
MTRYFVPPAPPERDLIARIVDVLVEKRAGLITPLTSWRERELHGAVPSARSSRRGHSAFFADRGEAITAEGSNAATPRERQAA